LACSQHPPREFDDLCFKSSHCYHSRQLEDQGMVSRAAPFVTICLLLWIAHCQLGINDPCDTDIRLCGDNAVCMGSDDNYTCTCMTGYSGNGTYCYDLDECKMESENCSAYAFCTNTFGSYSCTCKKGYIGDGISCSRGCEDGEVRLKEMYGVNEMLVEICYNSTWGLVCDDQWGANDTNAQVVCNQLCFESGEKGKICPNVSDGTFWLDEVNCKGDEGRLDNCTHSNIGEHDCTLAEAVTVVCSTNVCLEGTKCTQHGYCTDIDECAMNTHNCTKETSKCVNTPGSFFCMCLPGYTGDDCEDIDECEDPTLNNCDVNAMCINTPGCFLCMCNDGYIGDGTFCVSCNPENSSYLGFIQNYTDIDECALAHDCDGNATCFNCPGTSYICMCNKGFKGDGKTCNDIDECELGLDDCDESAICTNTEGSYICTCREGYSGNGRYCPDIDECELGLDDCDESAICTNTEGTYTCTCREGYFGDGINCTACNERTGIRLAHGNETSGLVEVLRNCEWKSVCDDYWTDLDAKVACRQLELLPYAAGAYSEGKFRYGEEVQYWLDDVQCTGNELLLFDCPHKDTPHNCRGGERAGVHCLDYDDVEIRLVKNTTLYSGIIELRIRDEWRSVCHDKWTDKDAQVACSSMGFPSAGAINEINGAFEPGEEVTYWISKVNCQGDEESLLACLHSGIGNYNCGKDGRAKVICKDNEDRKRREDIRDIQDPQRREAPDPPCEERETRVLRNVSYSWKEGEGLVQICWMGQWRFVCDDGWDINAARVFCREHHLLTEDTAITSFHYHFDNDINQVHYWLDDIQCTGQENCLMDCEHERLGVHNCAQDEIAAVMCNGTEQNITLEPYPGGTAHGPFSNKGLKQIDYAIGAVATVELGDICGLIEFDLEGNEITVDVDILGLKATERYNWGINDDATGICTEIPFDPAGFLENCNYNKHCRMSTAECAAGDYTHRFGSLDGSGRKTVLEKRITLQALLNNSFFINIEGEPLCGKLMPVFECEENDIVMTIVANSQFLGPIEVCIHNRWHRVCDSNWTKADATVSCRQLKLPFSDAVAVYFNEDEVFTPNEQNVTDGCECVGTEFFYSECVEYPTIRPRGKNERVAGALCQSKE
jgi:hypothetical protein